MPNLYYTTKNEPIDLSDLNNDEKKTLNYFFTLYQYLTKIKNGWFEFEHHCFNQLIRKHYDIDSRVYKVLEDLWIRLGIQQGDVASENLSVNSECNLEKILGRGDEK